MAVFNDTSNPEEHELSRADVAYVTILFIITVLGICLNICVIIVHFVWLLRKRTLTNTGIIVTNMSISDLFAAVFLPIIIITQVYGQWRFSEPTCKASIYIGTLICSLVSAYTVVVLVLDKLIIAFTGKTSLRWWYALVMLGLWIVGAAVFSFTLLVLKVVMTHDKRRVCTRFSENNAVLIAFTLVPFLVNLVLPVIAVFVLWFFTIISKLFKKSNDGNGYESTTKHYVGVALMSLAFVMLSSPINTFHIVQQYMPEIHVTKNFIALFYALTILHEINLVIRPVMVLAFRFVWPGQKQPENNGETVALKSTN